jgi:hypothetical protein
MPDRQAIPIDNGVPTGSILLGPVKRLGNAIF